MLVPKLEIDAELAPQLLSVDTAELVDTFNPFGSGNPEPVFAIYDAVIAGVQTIGRQAQHLKLLLKIGDRVYDALAWGKGEQLSEFRANQVVSVAATLGINEWKNRKKVQLIVKDISSVASK